MDKINNVLTTVANIGIVAGLVLVYFQMEQNERLLRVTLLNQYNESYISVDTAVGGEELYRVWAKSFEDPENLSTGEKRALEAQTFSPLLRWANLYRLYRSGLIESSVWKDEIQNDAGFYFSSPYSQAWWEIIGTQLHTGVVPTEVKEHINSVLSKGVDSPITQYEQIDKRVREIVRTQNDA